MIFISYCNENDNSHKIFTNLPTCFLRIQNVFFYLNTEILEKM